MAYKNPILEFSVGLTSYENIRKDLQGTCHFYHKRWYDMKYGLEVFKEGIVIDDIHREKCTQLLTQMSECNIFFNRNLWFKVEEINIEQRFLQQLIICKKPRVKSQCLAKEKMLQEVYIPSLCISLHFQNTMNKWKIGRWKKTSISMWLRGLKKITYDHLSMQKGTCECVG